MGIFAEKMIVMVLPWYNFLPVAAGIIGGLIGGYYYKKEKQKKL